MDPRSLGKGKEGGQPDYSGSGVAVWKNVDKNDNEYLTVQILGRNGIRVNAFPRREFDFTIVVVPNKGEEERFVHALSSLPADVRLLRDLEGSIEWCLS